MKNRRIRVAALLLALLMPMGVLASCGDKGDKTEGSSAVTTKPTTEGTEKETGKETEQPTQTETTQTTGSESTESTETETTAPSSDTTETTESTENTESTESSESSENTDTTEKTEASSTEETETLLEGEKGGVIENAHNLANKVQSYYPDPSRSYFVMENGNVVVSFDMESAGEKQVEYISTKDGRNYIENTMDVFIRMKDGGTYFASSSADNGVANIYKLGYYYYENRVDGLSFVSERKVSEDTYKLKHPGLINNSCLEKVDSTGGEVTFRVINNEDPYVMLNKFEFSADDYNMLMITMKADANFSGNVQLYVMAGDSAEANTWVGAPSTTFPIETDGEYHTYLVPLDAMTCYFGSVKALRLDTDTHRGSIGATFSVKEILAVKAESTGAPLDPRVCRIFGAYSDKLHHTVQVSTYNDVADVDSIGTVTNIPSDKVSSVLLTDAEGIHYSIEETDMATLEYAGFMIDGVGVYGVIMPYDGKGGSLEVTLEDGIYSIIQEKAVKDGTLVAPQKGEKNANDFYMGSRIYTDEEASFDAFIVEAELERHPLTSENFIINEEKSTFGEFVGYDSLRGIYTLMIDGVDGFNPHFKLHNNRQYNVSFALKGDGVQDRSIYVLARYEGGSLECAAFLDENMMLIPVPLEVGKNFADGGGGIYDIDDARYSETILPLIAYKDSENEYSIVNMYHKWGAYLLKQISYITYFAPYYHLSTGVHESNCIIPWYWTKAGDSLNMLPDHRPMSAPLWEGDPQHTYCGDHSFLQYTDAEGNYSATESTSNLVGSYGPIYADLTMNFISDDGRMKVSYNHMEMPQTDENRAYYEMRYEVLEDISFKDFANSFSFYKVRGNDPAGLYSQVGYLDTSNASQVVAAAKEGESFKYTLGDNCPYFSFFNMENYSDSRGYSNLSFLVGDYELIIGGEKSDAHFAIVNTYGHVSLTLDLDEVTLKKGDSFKINAIIMPWGSQESDYSGDAPDKNVRDVRENSLLSPYKVSVVGACEVVESSFLPAVRTTNGKTAIFTLSGGENNAAVRVYGFDKLTVPVVEEKTSEGWQEIKLASINTPDAMGFGYQYDGYMVYYDGDGTYSYAFVLNMDGDAERTIRVTAASDFEGWPEIVDENENPFFFDGESIYNKAKDNKSFIGVELIEEGEKSFTRFKGAAKEAYFGLFAANDQPTGDLLVIKYRSPASNKSKLASWNIFTSTVNDQAVSEDSYWASGMLVCDGEWQVLVIDLSVYGKKTFVKNDDGEYVAKYVRIDIFNDAMDENVVLDVESIAMYKDIADVLAENPDIEDVMVTTSQDTYEYVSTDDLTTLNIKLTAAQLYALGNAASGRFNSVTLSEDESYVTFAGCPGAEATLLFLNNNTTPTGQFVIFKYRVRSNNPNKFGFWEVYTSTVNESATGPDSFSSSDTVLADDEWHVMILDLASLANEKTSFNADENGVYTAKYLRFDIFNSTMDAETSYDMAYFGMCDSLDRALDYCKDEGSVMYITARNGYKTISTETGEEILPPAADGEVTE